MRQIGPDAIPLRCMRFHALVGILPHEREIPQPVELDLTVWVRAGSKIVDYRGLYAIVSEAMKSDSLLYLEEIAGGIASRVLSDASIARTRVTIRKPNVALGG